MTTKILEVSNLFIAFDSQKGSKTVVHGVNFHLNSGECVGLIGESGSGKTVSMKTLLGAPEESFRYHADQMTFQGQDLTAISSRKWRQLRGKSIAYIPQNPAEALTPHDTIKRQFEELASLHKLKAKTEDFCAALKEVGLSHPEAVLNMYPHQLSGGMAQRIAIAMSLLPKPVLLIADEPTSAIDASLKATVLSLIKSVVTHRGLSLLIITHDFEVVANLCQRAYVMHKGIILEDADVVTLLEKPKHPYTAGLVACYKSLQSPEPEFYQMPNWENNLSIDGEA